jgi:hypothetical protein
VSDFVKFSIAVLCCYKHTTRKHDNMIFVYKHAFYYYKTHMTNTWVCDEMANFAMFPLFRHYLTLEGKTDKVS